MWISSFIERLASCFFFTANSSTRGLMVMPYEIEERKKGLSPLSVLYREQLVTIVAQMTVWDWCSKWVAKEAIFLTPHAYFTSLCKTWQILTAACLSTAGSSKWMFPIHLMCIFLGSGRNPAQATELCMIYYLMYFMCKDWRESTHLDKDSEEDDGDNGS